MLGRGAEHKLFRTHSLEFYFHKAVVAHGTHTCDNAVPEGGVLHRVAQTEVRQ